MYIYVYTEALGTCGRVRDVASTKWREYRVWFVTLVSTISQSGIESPVSGN